MSPPRWWLGALAFVLVVVLHALATVLARDDGQAFSVLGLALGVGLVGTAVGTVVAQRRPDARAVALGLVWSAPVCAAITSAVVLA